MLSGDKWFNLPSSEMTEDLKMDLRALKMRGALDPKRFYKVCAHTLQPRPPCAHHSRASHFVGCCLYQATEKRSGFLQVGTVVEGATEYFSSRLTKKERKQNIVDELMHDEKVRTYAKKKFSEIQDSRSRKKRFGMSTKRKRVLSGGGGHSSTSSSSGRGKKTRLS